MGVLGWEGNGEVVVMDGRTQYEIPHIVTVPVSSQRGTTRKFGNIDIVV